MPVAEDTAESEPEDVEEDRSTPDSENDDDESDMDTSGSEDSSEFDEEDCERRRVECLNHMNDLERQFTDLKEQLYVERVGHLESKLGQVQKGDAMDYHKPLSELEQTMQMRTHIAGVLRELRLNNIKNKYESEGKASHENHESEKMLLRDSLRADLEEKIRRLEEDRHNIDFTTELWNETQALKSKGKKFDLTIDRKKKPITVAGPYIVYKLRDQEILEDWTEIMKARGISARRKEQEQGLKPERNPFSARYDDGKLYYEGNLFNRRDRIVIENRDDTPVLATITAVNTGEVWVRRTDGTKSKLYIANLQKGKYTIRHT
ncbi:breast cancer metastasis-suppressor 1-like protein-A [Asterias rubens]|uniref:breast cancer metastasis-suppressor 1-like protein-A n=1 Tax=Asterias rubens TaxID=7604 RepID=UPI001455350F|nr:breast cancer metastasis-suppressor 1-like protein-A [Asterias rubens]